MTELKRAGRDFLEGVTEYEASDAASPRRRRVLPEDLDVEAELDRRFARPGVGLRVAMV